MVACSPGEMKQEINGKKETVKGFNVRLQDTILFPEGGGQVNTGKPKCSLKYPSLSGEIRMVCLSGRTQAYT